MRDIIELKMCEIEKLLCGVLLICTLSYYNKDVIGFGDMAEIEVNKNLTRGVDGTK